VVNTENYGKQPKTTDNLPKSTKSYLNNVYKNLHMHWKP